MGSGWKSRKFVTFWTVYIFAVTVLIYGMATRSVECVLAAVALVGGDGIFYKLSNSYQAGKYANGSVQDEP